MRRYVLASMTIAALAATPAAALAQDSGSGGNSTDLKGPPNVSGFAKDNKDAASAESTPPADNAKMKGPPNADGAARRSGDK